MSLNAKQNPARRARLIEAAVMADYGLGGSNSLAAIAAQSWHEIAAAERQEPQAYFKFHEGGEEIYLHRSETVLVRWHNLVPLVQAAAKKLAIAWWPGRDGYDEIFGVIPQNFAIPDHTPWGGSNIPSWRYRPERGRRIVAGYHRCAAFLEAAAMRRYPHQKRYWKKPSQPAGQIRPAR